MLVGRVGATGGSGAGTAGQVGSGVRMNDQGWVGAEEAGPEFGEEFAGPEGRDAEFSGSKVSDGDGDDGDLVRISVKEG